MADDKSYCLGDLSIPAHKVRCANGVDEISFRVWGGMLRVDVRNTKSNDFKPVVSKSINTQVLTMILAQLNRLKSASPETNLPLVIQKFDRETKHWDTDWVFGLYKDNKMVYHIILQVKGSKYDGVLKGPSGIAMGSEAMSDADKSNVALSALEFYLKHEVPIQLTLTSRKREFTPNNGGGNSNNYSGGQNNNAPAPAGTSGEDYF